MSFLTWVAAGRVPVPGFPHVTCERPALASWLLTQAFAGMGRAASFSISFSQKVFFNGNNNNGNIIIGNENVVNISSKQR